MFSNNQATVPRTKYRRNISVALIVSLVVLLLVEYRSAFVSRYDKFFHADEVETPSLHKDAGSGVVVEGRVSSTNAVQSQPIGAIGASVNVDAAVAAFLQSTNFATTYEELARNGSSQALFVMAHIQDICLHVAAVEAAGIPDPRELPIVGSDNLELRQQAQTRLRTRSSRMLCANFPSSLITAQSVKDAYDRAASAGDVRAKLRTLEERLITGGTFQPLVSSTPAGVSPLNTGMVVASGLSTADLSLLRSALESRDPVAIRAAGPLLAGLYKDVEITLGPSRTTVDGVIGDAVWNLLACTYGGGCDASSTELSEACLLNSRCDVANMQEYILRYGLRPDQSQEVLALVARFQAAIDQGNWSFLQLRSSTGIKFDRTPFPSEPRLFVLRP